MSATFVFDTAGFVGYGASVNPLDHLYVVDRCVDDLVYCFSTLTDSYNSRWALLTANVLPFRSWMATEV